MCPSTPREGKLGVPSSHDQTVLCSEVPGPVFIFVYIYLALRMNRRVFDGIFADQVPF